MSCGNLCNSESLPWRQKDALKWRLLWSSCLLKKYIYISWKNKGSHSSKHLEWYVSKHIWWYTLPIYNRMIQTHNTIYIYKQESTPQLFLKGFFLSIVIKLHVYIFQSSSKACHTLQCKEEMTAGTAHTQKPQNTSAAPHCMQGSHTPGLEGQPAGFQKFCLICCRWPASGVISQWGASIAG